MKRIYFGMFLLVTPVVIYGGVRDLKQDLEAAIVQGSVKEVTRLLARAHLLSPQEMKNIVGLSGDIIEERLLLDFTILEKVTVGLSAVIINFFLSGVWLYRNDLGRMREIAAALHISGARFYALTGSMSVLGSIGFVRGLLGPRIRLRQAQAIRKAAEEASKKLQDK